jgi:hypothetical protein
MFWFVVLHAGVFGFAVFCLAVAAMAGGRMFAAAAGIASTAASASV